MILPTVKEEKIEASGRKVWEPLVWQHCPGMMIAMSGLVNKEVNVDRGPVSKVFVIYIFLIENLHMLFGLVFHFPHHILCH